jgi:ribonuclease HII
MVIVGLDEVGRGCWAGPLVAGAVAVKQDIPGLNDSKKLSRKQRENLDVQIRVGALGFGLGWVEPRVIDEVGLTQAVRLAMKQAIKALSCSYDKIIVDGNINFLSDNAKAVAIIKADATEPSVSAASIIAKVARDQYMQTEGNRNYPQYRFDKHVGYGTALHLEMLKKYGVCPLHRRSFKPVQRLLGSDLLSQ